MALTLTANIDATVRRLHVTGTVEVEPGYMFRIGDEAFQLQGFVQDRYTRATDRNDWYVRRGQDGSTAASHTAGASLTGVADAFVSGEGVTPPSPFTEGGPGGATPDLDAVLAGSVGQDIADALTGAAAPTVSNVFATMADVGEGGGSAGAVRWLGPCKVNAFQGQIIWSGGGDVSGGTFTLTLAGQTTAPIDWNAGSAGLIAAIEALSNVGEGNVAMQFGAVWTDVNAEAYIQFKDLTATALMTIDASGLTGPSSPYGGYSVGGANAWFIEMLTPAVGDIIEDFMHSVPVAFDETTRLIYTDDPDHPEDNSPTWAMPTSAQGINGIVLSADEFTNFSGNGSGASADEANTRPTALSALIAQWAASAADATVNLYQNLPAMVKNSVPIYSYIKDVASTPTQGEVWVWVKVSTPAPLMD